MAAHSLHRPLLPFLVHTAQCTQDVGRALAGKMLGKMPSVYDNALHLCTPDPFNLATTVVLVGCVNIARGKTRARGSRNRFTKSKWLAKISIHE